MPTTRSQSRLAKKTALVSTTSISPPPLPAVPETSHLQYFPFLKLPEEIRHTIYGYYFPLHCHIDVNPRHRARRQRDGEDPVTPAIDILLVNKQLAIEGARALYTSHNFFVFHLSESHGLELYPTVPRSISIEHFRLIPFLTVRLCFGYVFKRQPEIDAADPPPDLTVDWWYKGSSDTVEIRKSYVADLVQRLLECHHLLYLQLEPDHFEERFEPDTAWDVRAFPEQDWHRVLGPLRVGLGLRWFVVYCAQDLESEDDTHHPTGWDKQYGTGAEIGEWLGPKVIGPKAEKWER